MKIFNSKVKLILFSLLLIGLADQASAYRVKRYRDHWGIFGGYSAVNSRSIYENSELVEVHIDCRGWGDMDCNAFVANNQEEVMFPTDNIHCSMIDALFEHADAMQNSGMPDGGFTEIYPVPQSNGIMKNFRFSVFWHSTPGGDCDMQMEITEMPI